MQKGDFLDILGARLAESAKRYYSPIVDAVLVTFHEKCI